MLRFTFALYGLFFVLYSAACTECDPCMGARTPIAIRVSGCEKQPCKFPQGTNVTFELDFGVEHDVTRLEAKVKALALGVETVYPLPKPNVCEGLINGECPLDAGEEVTYMMVMPILLSFPKVHVLVQFYLESEHGIEVCSKFSGNVV